jgi:hypothetical protein
MIRILPIPLPSLSFFMALNLSTMGRTLPGLQNMRSRISSIESSSSVAGGRAQFIDGALARS